MLHVSPCQSRTKQSIAIQQLLFKTRNTYFASNAKAIIPAASGAEAEVPVCILVHPVGTSTVTIAG
jgi:hypothetical protein